MDVFADADSWTGQPFKLGSPEHLLMLTVVVVAQVLLIKRFRPADDDTKRKVRLALVGALWSQEASYHAWRLLNGTWTRKQMLPLHLCSVEVWMGGLMLLTRSYRLYEYVYFGALVGAIMAVVTPDAGPFGFPHYRFFQFFVSHGLIAAAPLWMTFGEGFRPTARSLGRAIVGTVAYAGVVNLVNRKLGSNYMFVNRKPETRSVLDALPPWPGYLPYMAGAVIAAFTALWAPWALVGLSQPTRS